MEIFIGWLVFSVIAGMIGNSRKIGFWGAFALSLFLSPLIGIFFALASRRLEDEASQQQMRSKPPVAVLEEELKRLEMLRRVGMLSETEYEEQRKKLLR